MSLTKKNTHDIMVQPVFKWIVRGKVSQREFFKHRQAIRERFEESCAIGDDGFWKGFISDIHIDRLLYVYLSKEDKTPVGFVAIKQGFRCVADPKREGYSLCSYRNSNAWYIELICADNTDGIKGKGGWMLDEVKRAAQAEGIDYLTLSALPYVVTYYYQKGFQVTMDPKCYEPQALTAIADELQKHIASGQYAKKAKGDPLQAPFRDPKFIKFLTEAVAHGLTRNRQKLGHAYLAEDERKVAMNAVDGVYMSLCLRNRTMEIQPVTRTRSKSTQPLRRSERIKKQVPPEPLRRSERIKKQNPKK